MSAAGSHHGFCEDSFVPYDVGYQSCGLLKPSALSIPKGRRDLVEIKCIADRLRVSPGAAGSGATSPDIDHRVKHQIPIYLSNGDILQCRLVPGADEQEVTEETLIDSVDIS